MQDKQDTYQVDMIASAKNAQWTPDFLDAHEVIKAIAPAKVNLFLGVQAKMDDGYHEVLNIMHALALHDTLYFGTTFGRCEDVACASAGPDQNISVRVDINDKTVSMHERPLEIAVQDNLIFKAIDAFAEALSSEGYESPGHPQHMNVRVEKNIPAQAGLGGGSADAAATLVALAKLWKVPLDSPLVGEVASHLGADVAFFLKGGCAQYEGAGDIYVRSLAPMNSPLVLIKPDFGVSTKLAYETFDISPQPLSPEALSRAKDATAASEVVLFNNLECAAFEICPALRELFEWLSRSPEVEVIDGSPATLLCGSGAALFARTASFAHATDIATKARAKGLWARATTFSSLKAVSVSS